MNRQKGFTLLEILVALFIMMVVLAIGYYTFLKVLKLSLYHSSVQKSQINTLMGTNLLRYDIEMGGYGLTQSIPSNVTYNEATSSEAAKYNNVPNSPPYPYQIGTYNGASYLVIRSTIASINKASKKWSIMYYDGNNWQIQGYSSNVPSWPSSEADYHFTDSDGNDYVIILHNKDLYANGGSYYFKLNTLPTDANIPPSDYTYMVYGADPDTALRMPFNRVDYFLDNSKLPSFCEASTYELYRATINQSNGAILKYPLLDCVKDFQVAIKSANGIWYTSKNPISNLAVSQDSQEIRVYIIQQSGNYNPSYSNSNKITLGDSDTGILNTFTPTSTQAHYQWKTIRLSIIPRNLKQ